MFKNARLAVAIASASVTAAATATAVAVDTGAAGYRARRVSIALMMTTADVVSNKPQTLKIQHSDTTDATNYSDISGFVGGTDFTIPNADTANANLYQFNLDMRGKKRYLKLLVSPRTTQTIVALASLYADQAAAGATAANVLALVEG